MDDAFAVDERQRLAQAHHQSHRFGEVAAGGFDSPRWRHGRWRVRFVAVAGRTRNETDRGLGARPRVGDAERVLEETAMHFFERAAVEQIHRVPGHTGFGAVVEDADHAGVRQSRQRINLAADLEHAAAVGVGHGLDRRRRAGRLVPAGIDDAHAATPELALDQERPDPGDVNRCGHVLFQEAWRP